MTDENRVIEKSRVPLAESERKRLRTSSEVAKSSSSEEGEGGYDLEVYDDRHFYSQMLKVTVIVIVILGIVAMLVCPVVRLSLMS